jgi:Tol biopolymer transport system component
MRSRGRLITMPTVAVLMLCVLILPSTGAPRHALASSVQNGRIAFESNRPTTSFPTGFAIYTANPDGSGVSGPLTHTSDHTPAFSPDGTHIAWETFSFGGCAPSIGVMDADGSNSYEVANRCLDFGSVNGTQFDQPTWSPDGSELAYRCVNPNTGAVDICKAKSVDGSGFSQLTNNASGDAVDHPSWSPDGSQIAYALTTDGHTYQVHIMNADGSNDHAITPTPLITYAVNPAWSPDGTKIAFTSLDSFSEGRIFVMNADGTNPVQLTNGPGSDIQPAWSPDGTKLAFASSRTTVYNIYTMNADGSGQTAITNDPNTDDQPSWGTAVPTTTGARIATFGVSHSAKSTTASWRMADESDVLGFTLRAGVHILTRHPIPAHRSAIYHVVFRHTTSGPYMLTAYLRDGSTVRLTTS